MLFGRLFFVIFICTRTLLLIHRRIMHPYIIFIPTSYSSIHYSHPYVVYIRTLLFPLPCPPGRRIPHSLRGQRAQRPKSHAGNPFLRARLVPLPEGEAASCISVSVLCHVCVEFQLVFFIEKIFIYVLESCWFCGLVHDSLKLK